MAAARYDQLRELFEIHLAETESRGMLWTARKITARQGLQGYAGPRRRGAGSDHGICQKGRRGFGPGIDWCGAAGWSITRSRVYTTARNLAQQLRHTAAVALLSKSLAEEENAHQLLNQVARSLMSVAKMSEDIEQTSFEAERAAE
jgi:Mn-containing catalase